MVNLDELMDIWDKAEKDACDHNCLQCEMFLPSRQECFLSADKKWTEWNRKEKERFDNILKGEI